MIGVLSASEPPAASHSPSSESISAWLSTTPVSGESRAISQRTSGSIAFASAPDSQRSVSTPEALARAMIVSSAGFWLSEVATISLPQALCGRPRSWR